MNALAFHGRLFNDVALVADSQMTAWLAGLAHHAASAEAFARILTNPASAEPEFFARFRKTMEPKMEVVKGLAIVPIEGALAYAPDPFEMFFMGVEDSRNVHRMVRQAAADPEIKGVLLNVNSPGGMVTGGVDIADEVASMVKKGKPCVAWTGGYMASLAYQIGSQANAVVATRSSTVGSIGTMLTIADLSRMYENVGVKMKLFTNEGADLKGIGTPGLPLSEAQSAYLQGRVNAAAADFKGMVTAKRPKVQPDSMRGQAFWGADALERGLIDAVGSMDSAMAWLRKMAG